MNINEIIKTTRKIRNEKNKSIDNYIDLFEMIIKHFKSENNPELIICNSYNKYASTMFVDKWYIIYDFHLSEIMRLINEIYCGNQNKINCDKLMYKLYAEEFLLSGKTRSSFYCAEKYSNIKFESENGRNEKIKNLTKCQDIFILAHELSHWYFFSIANEFQKEALLNSKLKIINEYLNNMKSDDTELEFFHQVLSLSIEYVNCNDKLIEECICDMFAVSFALNHYNILCPEYNISPIKIAEYSFLCIHSLQLMCCIKSSTNFDYESNSEYHDYELTIRITIFRYYLEDYFSKYEPNLYKDFMKESLYWNELYNKNLYSGFKRISEDVNINCFELSNNDINILHDNWSSINDKINKILS